MRPHFAAYAAVVLLSLASCAAFHVPSSAPSLLTSRPVLFNSQQPTRRFGGKCRMSGKGPEQDEEVKRQLEDELKDSQGWLGYVLPRPVRKVALGVLGANSLWGAFVLFSRSRISLSSKHLREPLNHSELSAKFPGPEHSSEKSKNVLCSSADASNLTHFPAFRH